MSDSRKTEEKDKNKLSPKRDVLISEAIIRPTGLLDPIISVRPVGNQVDDVLSEISKRVASNQRVLITTLTKKFAEELHLYFKQLNLKSTYIHSDVDTLERIEILSNLRKGVFDILIGINLLREGLDLPEVSLVAIFDADKEGFLRSTTSLTQIIGRAARHEQGTVIMYADKLTRSMRAAIEETNKRRQIQEEYNQKHNITPRSTTRKFSSLKKDLEEKTKHNSNYGISGDGMNSQSAWKSKKKQNKKETKKKSFYMGDEFSLDELPLESRFSSNNDGLNGVIKFENKKSRYMEEIKTLGLSVPELQKRLEISSKNYRFEEAAAIQEIINSQETS